MRFTISPSILAQWSRVTAWQVYTLWQCRVSADSRPRGLSGNKDVLTQFYVPSSQGILAHFTFLHFSASFASFRSPLPHVSVSPCGAPVLLTYSSPLGFEKFSLFRHSWDHFSRLVSESEWLRHPGYCQEFKIIRRCLVSPETLLIRGKGTNILVVSLASAAIDRPEDKSESWGLTLDHHHYHYKVNVLRKDDISKHCCQYCAPVSYNKCQGSFSVWFLTELWWSVGNKSQTMRKIVVEIIHSSGWNWDGVS